MLIGSSRESFPEAVVDAISDSSIEAGRGDVGFEEIEPSEHNPQEIFYSIRKIEGYYRVSLNTGSSVIEGFGVELDHVFQEFVVELPEPEE